MLSLFTRYSESNSERNFNKHAEKEFHAKSCKKIREKSWDKQLKIPGKPPREIPEEALGSLYKKSRKHFARNPGMELRERSRINLELLEEILGSTVADIPRETPVEIPTGAMERNIGRNCGRNPVKIYRKHLARKLWKHIGTAFGRTPGCDSCRDPVENSD